MAKDYVEDRFEKKKEQGRLGDLRRKNMTKEEIEAEEAAIAKAKEERKKDPDKYQLHADEDVGRNDPCPCGSGKKYKKCCGKGK